MSLRSFKIKDINENKKSRKRDYNKKILDTGYIKINKWLPI